MRHVVPVVVALVVGVAGGWGARGSGPKVPPPSSGSVMRLKQASFPATGEYQFRPYRLVVDGHATELREPPRTDAVDIWRIDLGDGRVVLFATREPYATPE